MRVMSSFVPYLASPEESFEHYHVDQQGISDKERTHRLQVYGDNTIKQVNRASQIVMFLHQFKDLMIILLIVTAGISLYLQDYRTAIILGVIIFVNAVIGYLQEAKAERMLASLKKMVHGEAKVKIWWELHEISSDKLVPGDLVYIEEGDALPADLRIYEETNLQTNDFSLTGESNPQKKHVHQIKQPVELGDRTNMAFMWTTVAIGNAWWIVVGTGMNTELGKIAQLSDEVSHELSPLQKEFNHVAIRLTWWTVILGGLLFVIALGMELSIHEALMFAIGIAASMVPQGLPAQISVALSSAAGRLAHHKALVKKLSSVETLWSVNVICTDKTGTLTKNEMTVQRFRFAGQDYQVEGVGYEPVWTIRRRVDGDLIDPSQLDEMMHRFFLIGVAASNAAISGPDQHHATWYTIWDPTEWALISLAEKMWLSQQEYNQRFPELIEYSFDSVRKCMSSIRKTPEWTYRIYVKWSLGSVLDRATRIYDGHTVRKLTHEDRKKLLALDDQWAGQAMRNLAYAYKDLEKLDPEISMQEAESDLVVMWLVSMIDPPRETVPAAVEACHAAHIRIVIITGDYALTAEAIWHKIHIAPEDSSITVIEAKKLRTMSDRSVTQALKLNHSLIFSRMSPEDKIRIVGLCKKAWRLVAVTGDGVNDAPALKKADIWVAMWKTGTDVAKDAAEIVLLDDSFSTLVTAIKEGRVIFQNLRKTVLSSMTSNWGELAAVLLGIVGNTLFGRPLAISAVQILAIDLLGEMLPLAALTRDPPQPGIMQRPARDVNQHILDRQRIKDVIWSWLLMGWLAFAAFVLHHRIEGTMPGVYGEDSLMQMRGMSLTYVTIVLCQFMNILSRRAGEHKSVRSSYLWSNKKLLWSFGISLFLIVNLLYNPWVNIYFGTAGLTLVDWVIWLGCAAVFLLVREMAKHKTAE